MIPVLFFFDFEDFPPFVVSAARADGMRQAHLAAVAAGDQVAGFQRIVSATAIAAPAGKLTFWLWWHGFLPIILFALSNNAPADRQATGLYGFMVWMSRSEFVQSSPAY
jgi:hypothetical protein